MRFSVVTLFVDDPATVSAWHTTNFGLTVEEQSERFVRLADDAGRPCVAFHVGNPVSRAAQVQLHFEVDDVDAEYEGLRSAGLDFEEPPTDKPWGWRVASIKDPAGHLVEIVRRR